MGSCYYRRGFCYLKVNPQRDTHLADTGNGEKSDDGFLLLVRAGFVENTGRVLDDNVKAPLP